MHTEPDQKRIPTSA